MNSIFVEEENFEKARKKIREGKNHEIIFSSKDDEVSRKVLEKEKIDVLLIKQKNRKDRMKQRNSGLDLPMAKIAKKSGVTVGISLDEVLESKGKEKSEIMSRIKQNIMLCKKNKLEMKFVSQKASNKKDFRDLKALGLSLGMPTWMIKES